MWSSARSILLDSRGYRFDLCRFLVRAEGAHKGGNYAY
jgi:hypothetical protein